VTSAGLKADEVAVRTDLLECKEERCPEHVSDKLGVVQRQAERGGAPVGQDRQHNGVSGRVFRWDEWNVTPLY
jgi:hypothetical protein